MVDIGLRQHGVVLQFRLSQRRSVGGNDNQLSLSLSDSLESRLEAQSVFTTLDNEGELGVDRFLILLNFRGLVR
jgi:uncharacterized protein with ATP-grasp and redox domains